jgi:hypothetical protein
VSQNGPGEGAEGEREPREPVFTGPWPALALALAMLAAYAWQRSDPDQEALYARFGMVADAEPWRLVTALFVHGNWPHVVVNAVMTLAFGAGVSRLFGTRALGAVAFFVFFLLCGAFAGLRGDEGGRRGADRRLGRRVRADGRRLPPARTRGRAAARRLHQHPGGQHGGGLDHR